MNETEKEFGPEVPGYAILNEQLRQQKHTAKGKVRRQRKVKGQSQPDADKPK